MRCPFPRPIKKDPAEIEADSSWQAKESFGTKLRLVRISKQQRSTVSLVNKIHTLTTVNLCEHSHFRSGQSVHHVYCFFFFYLQGIRKMKRIPIAKPLPLPLSIQSMDKTHASEMKHLKELRATFQNNIDRINADWEKKLERKMAEMDKKLHSAKSKKWCPNCLKEVKFDTGFDPSACSIKCWKEIL